MRVILKRLLQRFGYDLVRYDPSAFVPKLAEYLRRSGINLFLDVGGNTGSTGVFLRRIGYSGRIISYEPGAEAHARLEATASGDRSWEVAPRMAIGDHDGEIDLFVSKNLLSSSTLPMLETHVAALEGSQYTGQERTPLRTLDSVLRDHLREDSNVFIKIDVQGAEDAVLRGAKDILRRASGIQLELSFTHLYSGQKLLPEMLQSMASLGFNPYAVNHGFEDHKSGRLFQLDCVFVRANQAAGAPGSSAC